MMQMFGSAVPSSAGRNGSSLQNYLSHNERLMLAQQKQLLLQQ